MAACCIYLHSLFPRETQWAVCLQLCLAVAPADSRIYIKAPRTHGATTQQRRLHISDQGSRHFSVTKKKKSKKKQNRNCCISRAGSQEHLQERTHPDTQWSRNQMIYVYMRKWEESGSINTANTLGCRAAGISSQVDGEEEG